MEDVPRLDDVPRRHSRLRGWPRTLALGVALLLGLQILFLGLNFAGALVPEQRIAQMLTKDLKTGAYPDTNRRANGVGGRFDLFTDCVVAGTGIGRPDLGPLERSLLMPRITPCVGGEKVIPLIADGTYSTTSSYLRYWGGYTVITKPALAYGGMDAMRMVSGLILWGGLAALLVVAVRRLGGWCAALLVIPLIASSDLTVLPSGSAMHSLAMGVAMGGAGLVLWATERSGSTVALTALAAGSAYCFVDLLSNPPVAWLLATSMAAAGGFATVGLARAVRLGLLAALSWLAGFALTWIARWVCGALAFGPAAVVEQVTGKIAERVSGENAEVSTALGAGVLANLRTWAQLPLAIPVAVLGAVAILVFLVIAARAQGIAAVVRWAVLALPAAIVPVWYGVLSNHSQIHAFFTYRAVPVAVGWGIAAAALVARGPGASRRPG